MMYNRKAAPLSVSLLRLLQAYHWPGNIRQLENLIKRYVILGTEACISADLAEPAPNTFDFEVPQEGPVPLKKITNQAVRRLEREDHSQGTAEPPLEPSSRGGVTQISYRALLYKIRDAGLSPNRSNVTSMPAESPSPAKHEERDPEETLGLSELMPIAKVSNA